MTHDCHVHMDQGQVPTKPRDMLLEGTHAQGERVDLRGERCDIATDSSQMLQDWVLDVVRHDVSQFSGGWR
jgi:hypothetical protein